MGLLYLAGLLLGLGIIGVQLVMSGHGDADAELDADADGDGDGGHHHDGGVLPLVLSMRFWTFGLAAFGLTGTLLHYLHLAEGRTTALVAIAMGLACGSFAAWLFRALARSDTSTGRDARAVVGQMGKVLVACERGTRGKVRIELAGQLHDYLITAEEPLRVGDIVLVESVRENVLEVSRAPKELLPPKP